MDLSRGALECVHEIFVAVVRSIVTTRRFADDLRDLFESDATRLLAFQTAADAVGDHHEGADALFFDR